MNSGDREWVKVVAVSDGVLVATLNKRFIFVDCDCICAVIADCLDVIADQFGLAYEEENAVVEGEE